MSERFIYLEMHESGSDCEEFVIEQSDGDGDFMSLSYGPNSGVYEHVKERPLVEMYDTGNNVVVDVFGNDDVESSVTLDYAQLVDLYIMLHHKLTAGATSNNKTKLAVYKEIDDGE